MSSGLSKAAKDGSGKIHKNRRVKPFSTLTGSSISDLAKVNPPTVYAVLHVKICITRRYIQHMQVNKEWKIPHSVIEHSW